MTAEDAKKFSLIDSTRKENKAQYLDIFTTSTLSI